MGQFLKYSLLSALVLISGLLTFVMLQYSNLFASNQREVLFQARDPQAAVAKLIAVRELSLTGIPLDDGANEFSVAAFRPKVLSFSADNKKNKKVEWSTKFGKLDKFVRKIKRVQEKGKTRVVTKPAFNDKLLKVKVELNRGTPQNFKVVALPQDRR